MSGKVVHFKSIGTVTFFRNRRSKSIRVSVRPDQTVRVSYPLFVPEREVKKFLERHIAWVQQQQMKAKSRKKKLIDGMTIRTRFHTIRLEHGDVAGEVERSGKEISLCLNDYDSEESRAAIEALLTRIYRLEAKQLLPPRLAELSRQYGYNYNKISIRNNRTTWGSCSSSNNISLNLQMMKLPDPLIDYILLHELVHTEIKNHSEKFWNRLDQHTGGTARELARQVKQYSTYTL
jgi:predicted metal-dependent hydrolase